MIAVAQSPIVMKMQGAWGAKDIFNEMAEEFVKRVNEMAEGRLRTDEDVQEGLENAYAIFMRLFTGANTGKLVLKIA